MEDKNRELSAEELEQGVGGMDDGEKVVEIASPEDRKRRVYLATQARQAKKHGEDKEEFIKRRRFMSADAKFLRENWDRF